MDKLILIAAGSLVAYLALTQPKKNNGTNTGNGNSPGNTSPDLDYNLLLQVGMTRPEVGLLQEIIGANTDDSFGTNTRQALVNFTSSHSGITYQAITLNDLIDISNGTTPSGNSDSGIIQSSNIGPTGADYGQTGPQGTSGWY